MVDSIGLGGQIPKISSAEVLQKASEKRSEQVASVPASDEVKLSEEALNLANAQKILQQVSTQLADNENLTLSGDEERLNALA